MEMSIPIPVSARLERKTPMDDQELPVSIVAARISWDMTEKDLLIVLLSLEGAELG